MVTWSGLIDRVTERLGEYDNQAPAGTTTRTYGATAIQDRLEEKYGELILDAARLNATRFATTTSMTYTADAESVAVTTAAKWRQWISVEDVTDANYPRRLKEMTSEEFLKWRDQLNGGVNVYESGRRYRYHALGANMWLAPKPRAARTLRITHVQAQDAYDAGNPPDLFPPEYHHLIALEAAVSFMNQYGPPTYVEVERRELKRKFMSWASSSTELGPRYVKGRS